jgi:formate-dependent nitrite reductase membrane component NrfD
VSRAAPRYDEEIPRQAGRGADKASDAARDSTDSRSYYGQPVIKEPVWTWEIPMYFFTGGLAGASASLAWGAHLRGNEQLARRAWLISLAGLGVSPVFLISDLGKPARFLNMLRMFKVTSPMSVGTWIVTAAAGGVTGATVNSWTGLFPRLGRVARPAGGILGLPLATYTAALIAQTAVPVWHEARVTLPFIFAGGAAASAGAAAVAMTPADHAAPARRLAVAGCAAELIGTQVMEHRLGPLKENYERQEAGRFARVAKALTLPGGVVIATRAKSSRRAALAGAALTASGALAERWAIFRAGFQSASDPEQTIGPQRKRIASGSTRGASS